MAIYMYRAGCKIIAYLALIQFNSFRNISQRKVVDMILLDQTIMKSYF